MSVNYIDLSSDEEVEIISEKQVSNKSVLAAKATVPTSSTTSAVEKLKRNSNIELTIDLGDTNDHKEKTLSEPKKENGLAARLENTLRELLTYGAKQKINGDQPPQKENLVSSDIIVIDNDEKEEEEKEERKPTIKIEGTKNGIVSYSNDSRRSCTAEKLQAPKEVDENGDEIFIIDDDDDDMIPSSVVAAAAPRQTAQLKEIKMPPGPRIVQNEEKNCPQQNDTVSKHKSLPPTTITEKSVNRKKVILSVSKSPKKSPPTATSSSLKQSEPRTNVVTPMRHKLPTSIVSMPSKIVQPRRVSSTPKGQPSEEVVILLDDPETSKKESNPEHDPSAEKPVDQSSSRARFNVRANSCNSPHSSGQSSSVSLPQIDLLTKFGIDTTSQEPINKYSIENMFDGLVKVSCKIFLDENLGTRLWRYFRAASEDVLKSEDFLNAVKLALKSAEDVKNPSFEDKVIISRNLKEVMRILKRTPDRVNKTLRKLNKTLMIINERIHKLETMEVTSSSDEESENVYCLLDRYRNKAAKIYSKICELEGKAAHAGRATLQKFHFSGTSGYAKIEHVLEKYFNKTRQFPDFLDVKKLIEATVEKEKLQLSPTQIHNIAQSVFLEFGNKLQRMRKCDDYTILVDYLDDGTKDPALDNEDLFRKLEENKRTRKKEEEILADYTKKQVELKTKGGIKSDEDIAENDSEGDGSDKEDGELSKKDLRFSDTEEELFNEDIDSGKRKRKSTGDEDTPAQPLKRAVIDLDKMEVNLKLLAGVQEPRTYPLRSSAEKNLMMDQLSLTPKEK